MGGSLKLRHDELSAAAVSIDADALARACNGFHQAYPARSAKRVLHVTQALAFIAIAAGIAWAFRADAALTLRVLAISAAVLFASAIAWRLAAAACLAPTLSRLAAPTHWPTYTVLCPLYREANIAADLALAIARLDYPGT